MRPQQKSGRSRGNKNRNKGGGGGGGFSHSPNRVYESAGPEGKVRGTPQQIIDKYQALARDAQLSGDRVTAENFLQHAEHYARILISVQEAQGERHGQQQPGFDRDNEREDEDDPRFGRDPRDVAEQPQPQPRGEEFRREGPRREDQRREEPRRDEHRREEPRQEEPRRDEPRRDEPRRQERRPRAAVESAAEQTQPSPESATAAQRAPEPEAQPELPAFITAAAPVPDALGALDAGPEIVETPESRAKPAERRPRKPRAKPVKPEAEAPEAAE